MATKMYNTHLDLLSECKEYYIYDTYMSLVYRAVELKDGRFALLTNSKSVAHIVKVISSNLEATYKTVKACFKKIEELGIITYDETLNGWVLEGMENMTKKKSESNEDDNSIYSGYTKLRQFFFTKDFYSLKSAEKKILILMAQLRDSNASKNYSIFTANLGLKSSLWLRKISHKKNKYYSRKVLNELIKNSTLFTPIESDSQEYINAELKKEASFKVKFTCDKIDSDIISVKADLGSGSEAVSQELEQTIFIQNQDEFKYLDELLSSGIYSNINISSMEKLHIIRAIASLKQWSLKKRVLIVILNKYVAIQIHHSREKIKHIFAYTSAVIMSVLKEYTNYCRLQAIKNYCERELLIGFDDYMSGINETIMNKDIKASLKQLQAA